MKKRVMDKRGQAIQSGAVNWIIVAVFLVIVVLGIVYFSDRIRTVGGNIPREVEIVTQACDTVASPDWKDSYCYQIRKVGRDKYVTCDYAYSPAERFEIENGERMVRVCEGLRIEGVQAIKIRNQINEMDLTKGVVNGLPVSSYTGGVASGAGAAGNAQAEQDQANAAANDPIEQANREELGN